MLFQNERSLDLVSAVLLKPMPDCCVPVHFLDLIGSLSHMKSLLLKTADGNIGYYLY